MWYDIKIKNIERLYVQWYNPDITVTFDPGAPINVTTRGEGVTSGATNCNIKKINRENEKCDSNDDNWNIGNISQNIWNTNYTYIIINNITIISFICG